MTLTHKIIAGAVAFAGIGGVGADIALQPAQITVDSPATLNWTVPTTDAAWAEDTKAESFDIKSGEQLNEIIADLTPKLAREQREFVKYDKCSDCIYWDKYEELSQAYPDQPPSWWDSEAKSEAQADTAQRTWSIQKEEQSIQRANEELSLRAKGFLVVATDTSAQPTGLFGAAISPNRIRHLSP